MALEAGDSGGRDLPLGAPNRVSAGSEPLVVDGVGDSDEGILAPSKRRRATVVSAPHVARHAVARRNAAVAVHSREDVGRNSSAAVAVRSREDVAGNSSATVAVRNREDVSGNSSAKVGYS
nr:hypothetical protein Itr_chr09CG14150 [Ipomoea trifida]